MAIESAADYADSLAAGIERNAEAGAPFGLIHQETEERTDDAEAFASFHDDEESPYAEASALDYLRDSLDIQYTVTSDRQYRSARVLIAFGGPNAIIDTRTGELEVTWWSAPVTRSLPREFVSGLDDALEELWEMGA